MFSSNVVGLANGFAAGWANVGSGVTQLVMPLIYSLLTNSFQIPTSTAWRAAFVVPAVFQAVTAILVLIYGQDLPDGNYSKKSKRSSSTGSSKNFFTVLFTGLKNYRGWILGLTYGYCFGVEVTMDNIVAGYFYDRFRAAREGGDAVGICGGYVLLLGVCSGGFRAYVWCCAFCFQKVTGSNIRDDREWWDCRSSGYPTIAVFRIQPILNTNQHFTHGPNDDCLYSHTGPHLFPQMGRYVLRPIC